jgi:hypothetical protein
MLRNLFSFRRTSKPARRSARPPAFRPCLEALEDRTVLSSYHWAAALDGNFDDVSKWLDQNGQHTGFPHAGDDARIGYSGITVTSTGDAVHNLTSGARLSVLNKGTLSILGNTSGLAALDLPAGSTLNVADGATLSIGDGTNGTNIAGTINLLGTSELDFGDSAVIAGVINNPANGHVEFLSAPLVAASYSLNPGAKLNGPGEYLAQFATVTEHTDLSIQNFTLGLGGGVTGSQNLTITGTFNWAGGELSGGGTVTIAHGATLNVSKVGLIRDETLNNHGAANWVQTGSVRAAFFFDTPVFNNLSDGTVNLQNDTSFWNADQVNNQGVLNKSSPILTGTSDTGSAAFNNSGTVNVASGQLLFASGGLQTGAFKIAAAGLVTFDGAQAWGAGVSFAGASPTDVGVVHVGNYFTNGGGTVSVLTNVTIRNLAVDANDTIHLNAGTTLTVPGQLDVGQPSNNAYPGNISGAGNLVLPAGSVFNLEQGGISTTGTTTIQKGATLDLIAVGSQAAYQGSTYLSFGTLINQGTVNYTGTGNFAVSNGATVKNQPGGVFLDANDHDIGGLGGGFFYNAGTYTKSSPVGTGSTSMLVAFNTAGTINVASGALGLPAGTAAGVFNLAAGSSVDFVADGFSTYTLNTGTQFNGAGTAYIAGLNLVVNGAVTASNFWIAPDASTKLTGSGSLRVTGALTWTGGNIGNVNGDVTLAKTGTLTIKGTQTKYLFGGILNLLGKTVWQDSGNIWVDLGGTINNEAGASFTITNDQTISNGGTFNNLGTLTKSGLIGTTTIGGTFNNGGSVIVKVGTLNLSGGVGQVDPSGTTLTGGSWSVIGSGATLQFSAYGNLKTIGTLAAVTLSSPTAVFTNLAGLTSNLGAFSLLGGITFTTAGDFNNSGTLTLGPGSTLAVNGSFVQTAAGTLNVQIGGTAASPTAGTISTSNTGTVTLDGTLNMTASIKPAVGTTFKVVNNRGSSAIHGIFAGLPEGATLTINGMTFKITYKGGDGNDVVLTRTA